MKLHISNLPPDITEEELKELFSQFGKVKSIKLSKYPPSLSNSYGFIDKPASAGEVESNLSSVSSTSKITIAEEPSRN